MSLQRGHIKENPSAVEYGGTNYLFDLSDPQTAAVLPGRYHFELDGMTVAVPGPWELSWNLGAP